MVRSARSLRTTRHCACTRRPQMQRPSLLLPWSQAPPTQRRGLADPLKHPGSWFCSHLSPRRALPTKLFNCHFLQSRAWIL